MRTRKKVAAVVANARTMLALDREHGGFAHYLRSFDAYEALSADLRRRFAFLGELGAYYFLFRVREPVPPFEEWEQTIPGDHPRMREMVLLARGEISRGDAPAAQAPRSLVGRDRKATGAARGANAAHDRLGDGVAREDADAIDVRHEVAGTSAKMTSPSPIRCAGETARASPSCAIWATLVASILVRRALVATTASTVFSPATSGTSRCASSARSSRNDPSSGARSGDARAVMRRRSIPTRSRSRARPR